MQVLSRNSNSPTMIYLYNRLKSFLKEIRFLIIFAQNLLAENAKKNANFFLHIYIIKILAAFYIFI